MGHHGVERPLNGVGPLRDKTQAIRCDHDGLKMAEVQNGYLILRAKHHGETHVKIVSLAELEAQLPTLEDYPSREDVSASPLPESA